MPSPSFPRPVLVLFAHPALQKSRVNRRLIRAANNVEGVTCHDLYQAYPDFDIDVRREQELLATHHVIVFQHPFYWYAAPSLLKEWEDLVLEHGWAYGHDGTALHGKTLLCAISTGGGEDSYQKDGSNRFTIRELLAPLEQTASLCGMEYLPPFAVHGTHALTPPELDEFAEAYQRALQALRDDRIDFVAARRLARLNTDLSSILRG